MIPRRVLLANFPLVHTGLPTSPWSRSTKLTWQVTQKSEKLPSNMILRLTYLGLPYMPGSTLRGPPETSLDPKLSEQIKPLNIPAGLWR